MEVQENTSKQAKQKSFVKGFLSTVTAGVIGSVLTLTIVPHTSLFEDRYQLSHSQSQTVSPESINGANRESDIIATQVSSTPSSSVADIVENATTAIVGIVNIQNQNNRFVQSGQRVESGSGTGVIFKKTDDAAYIVTNNHVIDGASEIEISLHDGEKTNAEVIGADALTDLAVLKIDPKYVDNVLEFGDSSTLRAGDQVIAIGNPLGIEFSRTATQGIVSAVDRTISVSTSAGEWDLEVLQTDAAINPGNSGGALINMQGQVIGINSLKISESGIEGLGFAIPSNDVIPIANELIETGKIERPYIGISLASLEEIPQIYLENLPSEVTGGAIVTYIAPASQASKAGLKVEDIIIGINGEKIATLKDLRKYLYSELSIGDEVSLEVYRDGELKTINMKLARNRVSN